MATKVLNIRDFGGYIKCGEILKSPLPNYEYPFVLKCYQCDKINFILESFIIHIQEHCKGNLVIGENIDIKIPNDNLEGSESIGNPLVKVETIIMDLDDPLVEIKDETVEETSANISKNIDKLDDKLDDNEDFEDHEDSSSGSEDEFETDDDDESDDDDELPTKTKSSNRTSNKRKSIYSPEVEEFLKSIPNMKVLIELYKNRPMLWNKKLTYYRFKDKRQETLEETTKELNDKLNTKFSCKELTDMLSYIYQKHRTDFKRFRNYEEDDKYLKNKQYKSCWFFDDLHFLRPKSDIQLRKLDSNLPDLTKEQVIQIIQMYRDLPHLWNSNLIEFICSNKRHAAHNEMLKNLETNMNIKLGITALEEYLASIHNYFSKEKRIRMKSKTPKIKKGEDDYYEQLLFLYDHEGPFNCSECKRVLLKPLLYKFHKSTHDDSVPFTCSQCNKDFKTMQSYTVHGKRHFEDLEFACSICGKKFVAYGTLKLHSVTHTGDRPYCCEICGASYRQVQCLNRHRRRHQKRYSHICSICSKGYYSKKTYEDHMNSHMNIRQHICQLCGKGFITSKALKTHAVTHEDARNHACKLCGKTFKLKIGVLQHMRTHGTRIEIEDRA